MTPAQKLSIAVLVAAGLLLAGVARFHAADAPKNAAPGNDTETLRQVVTMTGKLHAELETKRQQIRELRQAHPQLAEGSGDRESLKQANAAFTRLVLRSAEIDAELEVFSQAAKDKTDPRAVLLLLRRTDAAKGTTAPDEIRNSVPPADYVKLYAESLRLEKKQVMAKLDEVGNLRAGYAETSRQLAVVRSQEKDLQAELQRIEKMYLPLEELRQKIALSIGHKAK